MVGVSGFEPPAPASRRRCSTRLSYTPTVGARYSAAAGGPQAAERIGCAAGNSQAIHAGSYGPGDLDNTFGPQLVYMKNQGGQRNLPPSEGLQFFGQADIDGEGKAMTVTLKDIADQDLHTVTLQAEV